METKVEAFGKRLAKLIGSKGITRREFAKQAGISEVSISLYITKNKIPKLKNARAISKALDITVDELLEGTGRQGE